MTVASSETLYEYHLREWREFASAQFSELEDNTQDLDEYTQELAESYFAQYEEVTVGMNDPWKSVHYSAGVYLGEIGKDHIIDHLNNPENIPNIDVTEVTLMVADDDRFSDAIEEWLKPIAKEIIEKMGGPNKALAVIDLKEDEFAAVLYARSKTDIPEALMTLALWNEKNLDWMQIVDEFTDYNILATLRGLIAIE